MKPYITLYILGLGIAYAQGNTRLTYPIVDTGQESYYDVSQQISKPEAKDVYAGQDAGIKGNMPRYKDNGDGTISDLVTGLMWEQNMGQKMTLQEAEQKAKASRLGGYKDWRVPNIKELYSLIQFTGEVRGQQAVKFFIDTKYFRQPLGDAALGEREIDAQT